jgi:hypothetical protein
MKKTILLNFLLCATLSTRAQTTLRLHAGISHNYLNHQFEVDGYGFPQDVWFMPISAK